MQFKAILLDIDGTLVNNKKELTQRTIDALVALQQRGTRVVLASGRPTYGIMPLAKQLRITEFGGFILAFNGGVITDAATLCEIYAKLIPASVIPTIYDTAKEARCEILSYLGEKIGSETPEDQYVSYEAMLNKMEVTRLDSFVETFSCDLPKCLAVGEPARAERLVEMLSQRCGDVVNVFRSEPFFVEIVPPNVDKGYSLGRLCDHLGIEAEDMIAFGDGFNDLSMIEFAGCGVAMANAQDVVKASADYQTLSNEEDGVAHFVEQNLL